MFGGILCLISSRASLDAFINHFEHIKLFCTLQFLLISLCSIGFNMHSTTTKTHSTRPPSAPATTVNLGLLPAVTKAAK